MKKRDVVIATILFILSSVFGVNAAMKAYTNKSIGQSLSQNGLFGNNAKQAIGAQQKCSNTEKRPGLADSGNKYLVRLGEYEMVCDSAFADKLMIFTNMPNSKQAAVRMADEMTVNLKDFDKAKITPLVIIEPETEWGLVDFKEFADGFYDEWISAYFAQLKKNGITDAQMGIWVPFPEANLPYWNNQNATPADFATVVNGYLTLMKKEFSKSRGSILLNSATYSSTDFEWENGEYISLLPYVTNIKPGLVDSFGLQGFPWAPSAQSKGLGIYDAREYLNSELAIEAARKIGTREIWFNTGSFSLKYAQDSSKTVTVAPQKRKEILNSIYDEFSRAKDKGFNVWANIFSEDKSSVAEATNWTYIDKDIANQEVFADFARKILLQDIKISIYDVKK